MTIPAICAVVALAFAGYSLIESKGRGLVVWAVFLLALALLWPLVHLL